MPLLSASQLDSFAQTLLHAGGASREEAAEVASSLIGANLRGYDSHGVMRIPFYVDMIAQGETVPGAPLTVMNENDAIIAADAHWGFGMVQARRLMRRLIEKARTIGVGVGTLIHASHVGRIGEYCEIAAEAGMVSIVMANTHGAARRVAPPGGKAPRLGTNPIALGAPHAEAPLILDFSTSATAEGKVRVLKIAGKLCPEGWLLDCEGRPTTDPASLYGDPPGSILPMGGSQAYKGFGLALMIDIFAGALSGGLCARETPITPKGNCAFMMAIDPARFGGADHFAREVTSLCEFVRGCPRVEGVDAIVLPGDPERRILKQRLASGIPLDEGNWAELVKLAGRLGSPVPATQ